MNPLTTPLADPGELLTGGIIAAGEGSRLKQDGLKMPKSMVPVAGVPLIERVVSNFVKVGITRLQIIFNEDDRKCATFIRERFPSLDIQCIVKTTRSSYESFWEVGRRSGPGRVLMSTVDWICSEPAFHRFIDQAMRYRQASVVLAVTPFVADEKPLWVTMDPSGRVTAIGGASGDVVTAGLYLVSGAIFTQAPHPSTLSRLRDFLTWLVAEGGSVYGVVMDQVIDVDRSEDLQLAETVVQQHGCKSGGSAE
ncbi:MAG: NTP transferase domain-containing protein [candidate division NC10 bacterium]|nr:NTP transferase domain-containing protein [candidate division NC10 bacterium]MDE2320823.1 NTP transferase domain-containing protein [candidate division NC10 bacterium]